MDSFGRLRQELHGEMDALEIPPLHAQIAWMLGSETQQHRVEVLPKVGRREIRTDVNPRLEGHAFFPHLIETTIDDPLLHLELGDSVPEEPADPVVLLEDRYGMPGPSELLGSGKPGGTRSYDRDRLSGPLGGDHGLDEPVLPRMAHDLELDVLDGHRIVVDPENAGSLA